jgi:hypothetical protein
MATESTWSHDDVFPNVARAIETLSTQHAGYAEHDAIVAQLLTDPEAMARIEVARESDLIGHPPEWIAHNMVAWFSQRITVGDSDWADRFDRQKINGKWAYRVSI